MVVRENTEGLCAGQETSDGETAVARRVITRKASQRRGDLLFVQHLRYSIQMIFFNLLFALNRQYHPGGKRLLAHARQCIVQPTDLDVRWNDTARLPADAGALAEQLEALIDDLIRLIKADR